MFTYLRASLSRGIIQQESYRVLHPPWVVALKKVFNLGYTGCLVLYRVRTFSLESGLVRWVSGGRKLGGRYRVGGEGDALGEICSQVGLHSVCVCVCVCVWVCGWWGGGGVASPEQVYGVIYGLDIVALKFTRPLSSFFFLLTITPEERERELRLNQACVVFSGGNAFAVTASMTTVMVFVVTTWFLMYLTLKSSVCGITWFLT